MGRWNPIKDIGKGLSKVAKKAVEVVNPMTYVNNPLRVIDPLNIAGTVIDKINEPAMEAARLQGEAARAQLTEQQRTRELAMGIAAASPQELANQQARLQLQSQILGRTNRELEFLSKGLSVRTGGQSDLGQGLFSEYISRERAARRADLESTLRSRLGGGYATSSAGMAALSAFDQQTADIGVQAIPQFLQTAYGSLEQTGTFENLLKSREISALNATPLTPYAGAPFVEGIAGSRSRAQTIGSMIELGGTLGAAYLGGPAGAAAFKGASKNLFPGGEGGGGGAKGFYDTNRDGGLVTFGDTATV